MSPPCPSLSFIVSHMGIFHHFIDYSLALRCSQQESIGRIVSKRFVKDAGFGDCPMCIIYEFTDKNGQVFIGKHIGTESSYYGLKIGDRITIRFLEKDPQKNAPKDSLGIINPTPDSPG